MNKLRLVLAIFVLASGVVAAALADPVWLRILLVGLLSTIGAGILSIGRKSPSQRPGLSAPLVQSTSPVAAAPQNSSLSNLALAEAEIKELRAAMAKNATAASRIRRAMIYIINAGKIAQEQENYNVIRLEAIETIFAGSGMIHQNTTQAYAISDNVSNTAGKAFELAEQVQNKVSNLADELNVSLRQTEFLIEESRKIAGILEIMNQVASSTHVLSINASIVAARAGVHGKAFDVVSKEIRALANSTASSLENIEFIVNEIQEKIRDVAVRTKDTSISMLSEKETLLSVAGALQGVLLAVEVIRTVSSVSSEKALELQKNAEKASKGLDVKDESVLIPMINSALEDLEGIMNDLSEPSDNR